MSTAIFQDGRSAEAQESRIQTTKYLEMGSADAQECWSVDAEESRFQSANRSNMGNAIL